MILTEFWFTLFFFYKFIYLFRLCWVFVSVQGLPLIAASGGHSSSRSAGLSLSRPLLLRSTGSRRAGSAVVAHGPSRPAARGILPDQGSNRTRVPCIGRQTPNHCAIREALDSLFNLCTYTSSPILVCELIKGRDSPFPWFSFVLLN